MVIGSTSPSSTRRSPTRNCCSAPRSGIDADRTAVNPSGGALCANPLMAAGLARLAEAASRIHDGTADRALGHASSGPCLQQHLVCVLEGD